ncbi:hypothetical protein LNP18_05955 [Leuconostoc citreum]|uniref:hypothetical protein n=1 Tax=Leuconostoc citreum TaxID=33964 RepID=UPI00200AFD0A|nr:hypothetical protein [Leuconostoc citreum]MCK8605645.1 hypothetical protein [Leuconostoc citreum]
MKATRLVIVLGLLLAVLIGVQVNQLSTLDHQQKQAKQALVQAKQSHSQVKQLVASPQEKQANVKQATEKVTNFINTVTQQSTRDYDTTLKGQATTKVINTLSQVLAPSVTFGTQQNFHIVTVTLNRLFASELEYAVVTKSETQSVVYTLTFDSDEQLVTDIARLPLKGTYDEK